MRWEFACVRYYETDTVSPAFVLRLPLQLRYVRVSATLEHVHRALHRLNVTVEVVLEHCRFVVRSSGVLNKRMRKDRALLYEYRHFSKIILGRFLLCIVS